MKRLLLLVALLGLAFPLAACTEGRDRASAECAARAIEAKLEGIDRARHKNLCMLSLGYRRTTFCDSGVANLEANICYASSWRVWEEWATLME